MSAAHSSVKLADVLEPVARALTPEAGTLYRQLGVRLWGEGAYEREPIDGSQTKYSRLFGVEADDVVVNKIWARNGSVAVVSPQLAGAFVSSEFPTFVVDRRRLDARWFHWITKTRSFWAACDAQSQGTSGKNRIRPERFLAIEIPLPPLDEQRRIVARFDAIEARHHEADLLRNQVSEILDLMLPAVVDAELARLRALGHPVSAVANHAVLVTSGPRDFAANYTPAGPRFYRAQDIGPEGRIGDDNIMCVRLPPGGTPRATVLPGDVLVVITGATIGRSAVVEDHHAEGLVSQHVGLIRVDHSRLDPRYLHLAMLAPSWAGGQLQEHKYGQGKPGLNLHNLRDLRFPLPPLTEQRRLVHRVGAVRECALRTQRRHREITEDLAALRGSFLTRMLTG